MKVFVAGSTGVIGRALIPLLVGQGYDVTALVRSPEKVKYVETLGVKAAVADALDQVALSDAVKKAEPDVIIHQLTSHKGLANFKQLDEDFKITNRLRIEATETLLGAAREVGTRRFIAQSFCGWPFARQGGEVKNEGDPLDANPPAAFRNTLEAIGHLEKTVEGDQSVEGLVLRYGFLYGPGTSISEDGEMVALIRKRGFPVVGNGAGVWSFTHVLDAAQATVSSITRGTSGVYNIVDDEPASVAQWLPFLAQTLGAKPPRRVPAWLARPAIGEGGIIMMTQVRGGDNAKAKRDLDWTPIYASWRQGFADN